MDSDSDNPDSTSSYEISLSDDSDISDIADEKISDIVELEKYAMELEHLVTEYVNKKMNSLLGVDRQIYRKDFLRVLRSSKKKSSQKLCSFLLLIQTEVSAKKQTNSHE